MSRGQNELELRLPTILAILRRILEALTFRWTNGDVDDRQFIESVALAVAAQRMRAQSIGREIARRQMAEQLGGPVDDLPPLPGSRADGLDRLTKAVSTIVSEHDPEDLETTTDRLDRLGRSETSKAAQDAAREVAEHDDRVRGWVRDLNADACELCTWWWREGRVWPADHVMPRHPGCDCWPRPVTVNYTPRVSPEAQKRSDRDRARLTKEKA